NTFEEDVGGFALAFAEGLFGGEVGVPEIDEKLERGNLREVFLVEAEGVGGRHGIFGVGVSQLNASLPLGKFLDMLSKPWLEQHVPKSIEFDVGPTLSQSAATVTGAWLFVCQTSLLPKKLHGVWDIVFVFDLEDVLVIADDSECPMS